VGAAVVALLATLVGCGDDGATDTGDAGGVGAGTGGAGASGGGAAGGSAPSNPYAPERTLDPATYDCRAEGSLPAPAARPHDLGCVLDPVCSGRFVAAHRLGTAFAPENTRSALRAAILLGVDIGETDVRLTKDGRVVLLHDATIDRTLEGMGDVGEFTLSELEALAVRPDPTDPAGDFACERVLTLEDALELAAGRIVLEFETKDTLAGVATAEYLRDAGLADAAYVQCSPDECDAIRAAVPDAPIMVRVNDEADLVRAEAYAPKPRLVELTSEPAQTTPAILARVHALGAKAFTNAFGTGDALIVLGEYDLAPTKYLGWYEQGIDVLQSEYPHAVLRALGRLAPSEVEP
jgi:glycerophosphoryl diester phosphodiesterase